MALFNSVGRVFKASADLVVNSVEAVVPVTKAVGELGTASEIYAKDIRLDAESDVQINSMRREARFHKETAIAKAELAKVLAETKEPAVA